MSSLKRENTSPLHPCAMLWTQSLLQWDVKWLVFNAVLESGNLETATLWTSVTLSICVICIGIRVKTGSSSQEGEVG